MGRALPALDRSDLVPERGDELMDQAALADPGFADHVHDAPVPGERLAPEARELGELRVAAHGGRQAAPGGDLEPADGARGAEDAMNPDRTCDTLELLLAE